MPKYKELNTIERMEFSERIAELFPYVESHIATVLWIVNPTLIEATKGKYYFSRIDLRAFFEQLVKLDEL